MVIVTSDNCYPDEFEKPETRFTKLREEFRRAFQNKEITKNELNELVHRWKKIVDDWELQLESEMWI